MKNDIGIPPYFSLLYHISTRDTSFVKYLNKSLNEIRIYTIQNKKTSTLDKYWLKQASQLQTVRNHHHFIFGIHQKNPYIHNSLLYSM